MRLKVGDKLDVKDYIAGGYYKWYPATVIAVDEDSKEGTIQFRDWDTRWNITLHAERDRDRIERYGSQDYQLTYRGTNRNKKSQRSRQEEKQDAEFADMIYLYEPPMTGTENVKDIPATVVNPEWYIQATRECVLPNTKYSDPNADMTGLEHLPANDKPIGSKSHCQGQLLVFSFHVRAPDVIKIYLHWNTQIMRFFPSDILDVFPFLFSRDDEDGRNNDYFLKTHELQEKVVSKLIN